MNIAAIGGIVLTIFAAVAGLCMVAYQAGKRDGVENYLQQRAENRAQRRHEARAPRKRKVEPFHPFDDELFERMPADTGELRQLAEDGDMDEIRRLNAAFWRTLGLREWTRKRETAA